MEEFDTQAICPLVSRDLGPRGSGSPLGLLAVLVVPAQMWSWDLDLQGPSPTKRRQATLNSNSPPYLQGGEARHFFAFPPPRAQGHIYLPPDR